MAEEDDEEEEDKYRSKGDDVAKAPKRKPKGERKKRVKKDSEAESRRRRADSGDGEGDREQEVDEQTLRRRALDAKLDAIGKTGAKRRPKKRGDDVSRWSLDPVFVKARFGTDMCFPCKLSGRRFDAGQADRGYHGADDECDPRRHQSEQ